MRSASRTILTVLVAILVLSPVVAAAQAVPGATADERAMNGAKAYMKSKNLTSLKLNMMMPSIFTAGSTGEMANFEKATGIGVNYFEVGILQIQVKAKYGWEPGCPDTYEQWYQLAEFFTRDPKGTGVPELYGAMGYRARGWGWRWWLQQFYAKGGMPFDDTMKPLIAGKEGVEALKDYIALTKFMPKDILGWATPQAYPFFAGGNAFSIMTYPSIAIAAEHPEKSKIAGKNRYCLVPGYVVNGKLVRRSLQGFGNLLYVSNYSKHPEAAYWLAQYLTSKEVSARLVSGPNSVWDPYMKSHLTDPRVIKARTKEMLEVHLKNAQVTAPMILIQGAVEYNDVLDQHVQEALLGKLTPDDALNRTAAALEKITNQLGRKQQIEGWKALKPAFPTKNVPD